jgi:SpoVK/Ycf46/Vps4 family AAA+-type ATPase
LLPGVKSDCSQAIILLCAGGDLPPELAAHATVIEWPLPDRDEIGGILDATIKNLPESVRAKALTNGTRDAAIDAAVGLSGEEANSCYAKSLVQLGRVDPATVSQEKKRVISRERALEWHDPLPGGLSWVGGLEGVKSWIKSRAVAWTAKARAYGLPKLRGIFLTGISGCGKTLIAKAIAAALGVPLIRWDLNAARSKYVGESEGNIRRSLQTIEATGKCVVLIDEIEKALQGATSGSADGGVAADALGTVLTWMQERASDAFVIATANDITGLPPELLRKGRFDEVFFVDLPNKVERAAVIEAALRQHKRDPNKVKIDASAVADVTDKWTGAEIAQLVPEALFIAFSDGEREITTADLIAATNGVVPLSQTAKQKITALRAWGADNARRASAVDEAPQTAAPAATGRVVELS